MKKVGVYGMGVSVGAGQVKEQRQVEKQKKNSLAYEQKYTTVLTRILHIRKGNIHIQMLQAQIQHIQRRNPRGQRLVMRRIVR